MPTVVQSILLPPSQDIYEKILELEPSDTPVWIGVTNGVETVMYVDIPLQDYLPQGIQINIVDNKPDSANPSGEITLNRATIERGKGGRLIIAHEIGHAIASGRNQYDRNLLRAIANSQNVSLPTNRRIAEMINLTELQLKYELMAWASGTPYAKVFGISNEDWAEATKYGLATYTYPLVTDLIDFILSIDDVPNKLEAMIPAYIKDDGEIIQMKVRDLFNNRQILESEKAKWTTAHQDLQEVIERQGRL